MLLKLYDTKLRKTVWYDIDKKSFDNELARLEDCLLIDVRVDDSLYQMENVPDAIHCKEINATIYPKYTKEWQDDGRDEDGHFTGREVSHLEFFVDYKPNLIIKQFNLKGEYNNEK